MSSRPTACLTRGELRLTDRPYGTVPVSRHVRPEIVTLLIGQVLSVTQLAQQVSDFGAVGAAKVFALGELFQFFHEAS